MSQTATAVVMPFLRPVDESRRATRRASHRVPCSVQVNGAEQLVGRTINVSPEGVAVQIACRLPPGTRVQVRIPRRHGECLVVDGAVAHARQVMSGTFEIGVAFTR